MPRFDEAILSAPELARVADNLRQLVRPAIRLRLTKQSIDMVPMGQSRVGGYPDLPETLSWPVIECQQKQLEGMFSGLVALPFVAQLTCSEIASFDPTGLLPKRGRLYFFLAAGHQANLHDEKGVARIHYLSYGNPEIFRVLWEPDEAIPVKKQTPPETIAWSIAIEPAEYALSCTADLTLPHGDSSWIGEPYEEGVLKMTPEEWEFYADATCESDREPRHLMLGHTDDAQPYALEGGYAIVRSKFWPELPEVIELNEYAENILLLQLDADIHQMRFGRDGRIYFGIRLTDLRECRFEYAWAQAQ